MLLIILKLNCLQVTQIQTLQETGQQGGLLVEWLLKSELVLLVGLASCKEL